MCTLHSETIVQLQHIYIVFQRAWGRIIDTEADVLDPSRAPKVILPMYTFGPICTHLYTSYTFGHILHNCTHCTHLNTFVQIHTHLDQLLLRFQPIMEFHSPVLINLDPAPQTLRLPLNCKTLPFHLPEADCSIFTMSSSVDVTINFSSRKP